MNLKKRWFFIAVALVALASIAIGAPEKTAAPDKPKSKDLLYGQVELFADAVSALQSDYVDEVEPKRLMYGAMKGMLSSLDDYSQFMEPDEYREIQVETKGEFGGIGIEISTRDGILTIVTPIADTPAEKAGLKPNDKVVKIDGKITKNLTINESVNLMRGKPGSTVTLTIWRDNHVFDVSVKRDTIKIESIKKARLLEGKIGYVRLIEFQENSAKDLDKALEKLESQGMDSLILDLRNNPGGLLDGAIYVAERFLEKDKPIVSLKSRDPKQSETFKSSGRFTRPGYPLIVIVNDGSASASEIVAGAIQDNRRGIVMGTKTFGKASVQTVMPMKDGSALRFTTAVYVTPKGRLIKGDGIVPDVVVEREYIEKEKPKADQIFESIEAESEAKNVDGETGKEPRPKREDGDGIEDDNQIATAVNLIKAIKVYGAERR